MTFWQRRNVLVTGCTGFLGWALTEELVKQHANVIGLIRDLVPRAPFFVSGLNRKISAVHGSVQDYDVIERALNEYEIDTVFHLAAQTIVGVANRNPLATFETNIQGTWTMLEACRRNDHVSRVVVASSDKAYGVHDELPYNEAHALKGSHPYDVSKSCADLISSTYHNTYQTPVCVTRCGNLFGPGDLNFSRIVPGTIRSVLRKERPIIRSDGSPIRDYAYVKDIVDAYLLLAERMDDPGLHGRAFNFASGEPLSVMALTELILDAAGCADLEPNVLNQASGEIHHQYLSSDLARETLGWRPGVSVAERLGETIAWYRTYLAQSD